MKKHLTAKSWVCMIGIIFLCIICIVIFAKCMLNRTNRNEPADFSVLLQENNVTYTSSAQYLEKEYINGMLLGIQETEIIKKYEDKKENAEALVELTAEEVLEIHYYSLDHTEREKFWTT